jgi:hypothetical protein
MDSARHVIRRNLNPLFLSQLASCEVASTIHQSLSLGHVISTAMRHQGGGGPVTNRGVEMALWAGAYTRPRL